MVAFQDGLVRKTEMSVSALCTPSPENKKQVFWADIVEDIGAQEECTHRKQRGVALRKS